MPSPARIEDIIATRNNVGLARRLSVDAPGLTKFRALAAVDNDRSLSTLIESEIIPRLMMAHAIDLPEISTPEVTAVSIDAEEIAALAPLALEIDADALLAHIEAVMARGVSVDMVLVDLLAPTARLLGEYWEDDRCDFVDVTMGLWRLQEVVHEIAARMPADRMLAVGGYRALFASMPGDQHSFGAVVIDEVFRRDGWKTERMTDALTLDLVRRVVDDWFDLVGLTVSCDCHIAPLPSAIATLRSVSRNPRLCIMVGGRAFSADPGLAVRVGADGTAKDAKLALKAAADMVRARKGEYLA
ncbi:MAG TPA: cobalamin B12-binding domain-containing protein [Sphingomonas sp.]|jgi:methanogenic corrinoid protein MtbC1|nr:cobalamin B12-binding domain-containing protein [Sphingomonas sp.]